MSKATERVCAREKCQNTYQPKVLHQKYCGDACASEADKERFRARRKRLSAARGEVAAAERVEEQQKPADDPGLLRERARDEELKYLRQRNREQEKLLANREEVMKKIADAARVPVAPVKLKVASRSGGKKLPVRSAVVPVYDVQYGQLVQPGDTPLGLGAYSDEIFRERLARWLDGVTGSMRDYAASHHIAELVIPLGGDLVEGADIFAGQAWQLEKDPARQAIELASYFATALTELITFSKEELGVERVMITSVPGNHGKVGGKRAGAIPSTMSWDWVCVEFLREKLRNLPVDVWGNEPGGALLFETMGHLFLQIHGQEIRGWGGLPFYGLTKFDGRVMRLTGEVFDYALVGHHHQPALIPNGSGGEYIFSGDWVGANNLSGAITAASRPQQRLLFVSEKWGVTENVPIYFTRATRPAPRIFSTDA